MASCTFFGHRRITSEIKSILITVLKELIEQYNVDTFYVGNQGSFDKIVVNCLEYLSQLYPNISYYTVFAYLPTKQNTDYNYKHTLYPQELENVPPRFAINKRNEWLIKNSNYVVTYVEVFIGGAKKFEDIAKKKGKTVINIVNLLK